MIIYDLHKTLCEDLYNAIKDMPDDDQENDGVHSELKKNLDKFKTHWAVNFNCIKTALENFMKNEYIKSNTDHTLYNSLKMRCNFFIENAKILVICEEFCSDESVSLNTLYGGEEEETIPEEQKRATINAIKKVLNTIGKDRIQKMLDSENLSTTFFEKLGHILNAIVRAITFGLVGYEFSTKESIDMLRSNFESKSFQKYVEEQKLATGELEVS